MGAFSACGVIITGTPQLVKGIIENLVATKPCVASISVSDQLTLATTLSSVPLGANETFLLPTGVSRLFGVYVSQAAVTRVPPTPPSTVQMAVMDTGIDAGHLEFFYDPIDLTGSFVFSGINCVDPSMMTNTSDDNGHGTHVAGTIGAGNNGVGTFGLAPGIPMWAIKIFNSTGQGNIATALCGLNWLANNAASNNIKVAALPWTAGGAVQATVFNTTCGKAVKLNPQKIVDDGNCGYVWQDPLHMGICNAIGATSNQLNIVTAAGNGNVSSIPCEGDGSNTTVKPTSFHFIKPAAYRSDVLVATAMTDEDGWPGEYCNEDPFQQAPSPAIGSLASCPAGGYLVGGPYFFAFVEVGGTCGLNSDDKYSTFSNFDGTSSLTPCQPINPGPPPAGGKCDEKGCEVTPPTGGDKNCSRPLGITLPFHWNHTLSAPGCCIFSTWPNAFCPSLTAGPGYTPLTSPPCYSRLSGTSMSTAHVAAVAALCWSGYIEACFPLAPADFTEVISRLVANSRYFGAPPFEQIPYYNPFSSPYTGSGPNLVSNLQQYFGYLPEPLYGI